MNELPPPSPGIGRDKNIRQLTKEFELTGEVPRIYSIISDEAGWPPSLQPRVLKSELNTKVVVALPDFTRIEFFIEATKTGTTVTILHDLIKSAEDHNEYIKIWDSWFAEIEKRVSL